MGQSGTRIVTGQIDFSEGVDSGRVPTIAGVQNPNGLRPTQLAWLNNGTCRGGGVATRNGWNRFFSDFDGDTGLFQGGHDYQVPGTSAVPAGYPNIIFVAGGRVFRLIIQPTQIFQELFCDSPNRPIPHQTPIVPAANPKCYFCQGEEFLVIQAGDFVTQPLVWDGATLRWIDDPYWQHPGIPHANMLPPGKAMDYFQGRFWVQNGERTYMAGDTVGSSSGIPNPPGPGQLFYNFRDAILHSIENGYLQGAGAFAVPSTAGSIRSIDHTTNLDSALGDSNLFVSTRNTIFSVTAPIDRATWLTIGTATGNTTPGPSLNGLKQTVAMKRFGVVSDRSVVVSNGDMFFRGYDGIRSLYMAVRYFNQWGQTPISNNVNRVLSKDDRSLIHYASGIEFDNRLLETCLPVQTPVGVGFQALAVLDFDLLTSLQEKKAPAWEGIFEGLDILQLWESDFGGLQRAFAAVHARNTGKIEIWEITSTSLFENGDNRITMVIETPAYTWEDQRQFKKLDNLEAWFDQLYGTVDIDFYYRPDQDPCWTLLDHKQLCAARNSCELLANPICGYLQETYCAQDRIPVVTCSARGDKCELGNRRPVNFGYQFQIRMVVKGRARLRGLWVWAFTRDRGAYEGMNQLAEPSQSQFPANLP